MNEKPIRTGDIQPSITKPFEEVAERLLEHERFQVKIIEGVPVIRDSHTEFIYRLHVPSETFALVHLVNELIKPPKKKRKRHHRQQLLKEAGIEPQTGDPSL